MMIVTVADDGWAGLPLGQVHCTASKGELILRQTPRWTDYLKPIVHDAEFNHARPLHVYPEHRYVG